MKKDELDILMDKIIDRVKWHIAFEKGYKNGREQINRWEARVVRNLLQKTNFTIAQIAELAGVTPYFVRKVRKAIQ